MSASRWRDERGLTLPIVALLVTTIIFMVSFAVDLGRQRADRRLAQAGADVVALDMMRVVEGRTLEEVAVTHQTTTMNALSASATRNGFRNDVPPATASDDHLPRITGLQWGVIVAGSDGDTFEPLYPIAGGDGDQNGQDDLEQVPNAVEITAERLTDFFFQTGDRGVTRTAIAALPQPVVSLTVGSVAAGFQPSVPNSVTLDATVEALNARLAAHFGATVPNPGDAGFDLVGYRGLAAADVDIWRVAANAGFASPNEMLESEMTVGQFFSATASALDQQAAEGDPNAANAAAELRRFETQMGTDSSGTMRLGDTLNFSQGGDDAAAVGSVNVLDLLTGGANLIDGDNFVSYSFTPTIPGVASASIDQYLVRNMTTNRGGVGTIAQNSQVRFQVNLTVLPLAGMTSPVTIPLVIEAANAEGVVTDLTCADPVTSSEADIRVTTSGVSVTLGTATDLTAGTVVTTPGVLVQGGLGLLNSSVFVALGLTPLEILGLNLAGSLTASSTATVLGGTTDMTFLAGQPLPDPPFQRAPGGLGAATLGSQLSANLTASQGGALLSSTATTALRNQLSYVFTSLQSLIIDPLLQQAGVAVAGADVKAHEMNCDGAGLKLVG